MNITNLSIFGVGIGLILAGLALCKKAVKSNWKVFIIGGSTVILLGGLSAFFGWDK